MACMSRSRDNLRVFDSIGNIADLDYQFINASCPGEPWLFQVSLLQLG